MKLNTFTLLFMVASSILTVSCGVTSEDSKMEEEAQTVDNDVVENDPQPVSDTVVRSDESVDEPLSMDDIIDLGKGRISQADFEAKFPEGDKVFIRGRLIYRELEGDLIKCYFGQQITHYLEEYPVVGQFLLTENGGEGAMNSTLKMGDTITFVGTSGDVTYNNGRLVRWNLKNCFVQ